MPSPPNDQYAILGHRLGFRLDYQSADLRARRDAWTSFALDGVPVRVRRNSVTVHDVINDTPNTCALAIDVRGGAAAPTVGQRLTVRVNSNAPRTLFAGPLQTVGLTYELQPHQVVYPCQAIDDTPAANRKLPYGKWVNASATQVAQWLVATFAPGFSYASVQAGLPAVTVNFDATEGMDGCLRQLAKLIGGYFYWEDRVLHLFTDGEPGDTPDPLDASHPFLNSPPIAVSTDTSQVRTRVYGKGYAEQVIADVAANETIVPISNAVMFNPAGGQAVTETQRLRYTGTTLGGGGTVVGPGIAPVAAPVATLAPGTGVTLGSHDYAVTFKTAAGESLPGPRVTINVTGTLAPPPAPTTGIPTGGAGPMPGTYGYAATCLNASGETLPGTQAVYGQPELAAPTAAPIVQDYNDGGGYGPVRNWAIGASVTFYYTYSPDENPTNPSSTDSWLSPGSSAYIIKKSASFPAPSMMNIGVTITFSTDTRVKAVHIWASVNGGALEYCRPINGNTNYPSNSPQMRTIFDGNITGWAYGGGGKAGPGAVPLTVPLGPTGTTARKLYRTAANGAQLKLLATLNDNTTTAYSDASLDAALGANAPTTNTATAAQVTLSGIPIGPATVVDRYIYRTAANAPSQLRLVSGLGNNTATGFTDTFADASLQGLAPTGDTSGIQQPAGSVLAGATSMVVAGAGWAVPSGGWAVIGNGQQTIRYTGISGNNLIGIPASGPGAITATVSYNSTITAAAALLGVSIGWALIKGAPINIWVQRDDTAAQASIAAVDHTDGIIEHLITDERRGEASLILLCDADLEQYAYPIRTVPYATRDVKTKSGKPITINLASPAIALTLTIQEVTITEFNLAPGLPPRFSATASSVRFSLEDMLRRLGASLDVTS